MDEKERLVAVEERAKSNTKRLDEAERKIEDIHDLTYSIKELASETKRLREDVNKIDVRLNTLEEKPAKNWDNLTKTIITRSCNSNFRVFISENWFIKEEIEMKEDLLKWLKCSSIRVIKIAENNIVKKL